MEKKIDFVKLLPLKRKGIGPIILLCATLILSPLSLLYSFFYCIKVRIRKTPAWYIIDDLHLGYAYFWGIIIFILGICLLLSYIYNPTPEDADHQVFFLVTSPWILSSIFILFYQARYQNYKMVMNALLNEITISQIQGKTTLEDNIRKNIIRPSISFNLTEMLDDLKKNAIIEYQVKGDTIRIEILSPSLKEYCIDENDPPLYEEWECKSCGAHCKIRRSHTKSFQCEYCGTEKLSCEGETK